MPDSSMCSPGGDGAEEEEDDSDLGGTGNAVDDGDDGEETFAEDAQGSISYCARLMQTTPANGASECTSSSTTC